MPIHTLTDLERMYEQDRVSLGIVRPAKVLDLEIHADESEWDPKWSELFRQFNIFGETPKDLRKIPFKFIYVFECEDKTKTHRARLIDREMGTLWLKEVNRLGNEKSAAESVRKQIS